MKRNILMGMLLIGALALGSCSTTQLASTKVGKDDDVYFSEAKAGDAPVYVTNNQPQQSRYNNYNDDDYYYYNSYASRINRFGYYSPFSYYNDIYMGYSPFYGGFNNWGVGVGLGFGWGGYYGFNNFYNPFYSAYYPYGYGYGGGFGYGNGWFGGGYGYGGGGYVTYGGVANNGNPRPYRGSGAPANGMVNRSVEAIGYNGNYPVNSAYPGRPSVVNGANGGRQGTNSYGNTANPNAGNARPTRDAPTQTYSPQPQIQSSPPPSSSGSSSAGSSGGGGGGGGGGARPVRP